MSESEPTETATTVVEDIRWLSALDVDVDYRAVERAFLAETETSGPTGTSSRGRV